MYSSGTVSAIAHFATDADYRIDPQNMTIDSNGQGWLNFLPITDNLHLTDQNEQMRANTLNATLLVPLLSLLDCARIKADISPSDERL